MARIVHALAQDDFVYALDVAQRFAWSHNRMILLAAIYGAAEARGARDVMRQVANIARFPLHA